MVALAAVVAAVVAEGGGGDVVRVVFGIGVFRGLLSLRVVRARPILRVVPPLHLPALFTAPTLSPLLLLLMMAACSAAAIRRPWAWQATGCV